jgi:hypothetical protein
LLWLNQISLISPLTSPTAPATFGREWVFAEIDRWLADPDAPRYFIITGEPGIGTTAVSAQLR